MESFSYTLWRLLPSPLSEGESPSLIVCSKGLSGFSEGTLFLPPEVLALQLLLLDDFSQKIAYYFTPFPPCPLSERANPSFPSSNVMSCWVSHRTGPSPTSFCARHLCFFPHAGRELEIVNSANCPGGRSCPLTGILKPPPTAINVAPDVFNGFPPPEEVV